MFTHKRGHPRSLLSLVIFNKVFLPTKNVRKQWRTCACVTLVFQSQAFQVTVFLPVLPPPELHPLLLLLKHLLGVLESCSEENNCAWPESSTVEKPPCGGCPWQNQTSQGPSSMLGTALLTLSPVPCPAHSGWLNTVQRGSGARAMLWERTWRTGGRYYRHGQF